MPNSLQTIVLNQRALCVITEKTEVAPSHFRFTFFNEVIAKTARAGHFVHVLPRASTAFDPLLRRAFSIVSRNEETFDILFKVTGRGTEAMSFWQAGDSIDLIGPLGQTFAPLGKYAILVGGGVGTPPMAMLASQVRATENASVTALIGARTGSEVLCREDFARYNVPMQIATDDGSTGHHGYVTDLLKDNLNQPKSEYSHNQTGMPRVYACGPLPMLQAVARICADFQVECQVSLEENMPCGVGVCNGCVIPVLGQSDDYGSYRRICVDGPVAWAHEVDWARWAGGGNS